MRRFVWVSAAHALTLVAHSSSAYARRIDEIPSSQQARVIDTIRQRALDSVVMLLGEYLRTMPSALYNIIESLMKAEVCVPLRACARACACANVSDGFVQKRRNVQLRESLVQQLLLTANRAMLLQSLEFVLKSSDQLLAQIPIDDDDLGVPGGGQGAAKKPPLERVVLHMPASALGVVDVRASARRARRARGSVCANEASRCRNAGSC